MPLLRTLLFFAALLALSLIPPLPHRTAPHRTGHARITPGHLATSQLDWFTNGQPGGVLGPA